MPFTVNGQQRIVPRHSETLVIGDTLALLYREASGKVKKDGVYGAKPLHHAQFTLLTGDRYYSVVAWPNRNHPYLVTDTIYKRDWVVTGKKKTILDFSCEHAYYLNTKRDTVSAWFTRSIPIALGPYFQTGLPGLVLEAEEHNNDLLVRAKKIERGVFPVAFPKVEEIVSVEEYRTRSRKRRQ